MQDTVDLMAVLGQLARAHPLGGVTNPGAAHQRQTPSDI
jgi:hypothetical protein